jgi:hypothetical protein
MARSLAVADCETDPFRVGRVPKPFIWGFYDGLHYMQFTETEKLVEFFRKTAMICYAHNGGKFDWHFLLPFVDPYSDVMIINGRIARINIGMTELRDSYNIIPVPLKAYKKDDIDYAVMEESERHKPENWLKITEYLRSDCVYLFELIQGFVNLYGLQITQAAAAMSQWKKLSKAKVPVTDKQFYDLISPYYYGGRVECFKSGVIEREFDHYDINSAYPYAMLHQHPYSANFTQVEGYAEGADFYKVNCVSRGAFPYRGLGKPNEFAGLRFPNDSERRIYTVTKWEYQAAIDTDTIRNAKVEESFIFDEHINFAAYIEHFYQMRLDAKARGNAMEDLFAKLLMNSLYGKFAANPEHYRDYMIVPMDVIAGLETEGWAFAGEIGCWGLAERPLADHNQRYYNVATGASITGFVRAMLWRGICGSKGVLYCDTDALDAEKIGSSIILGDKLGQWKHMGHFDRAGIGGKKLYVLRGAPGWWMDSMNNGKIVQALKCPAGYERLYAQASKGAQLTRAQLWQVARNGTVKYESEAPTFSVNKPPTFTKRTIKYTANKHDTVLHVVYHTPKGSK